MSKFAFLAIAIALLAPLPEEDTVLEPVTQTTFTKTWGEDPVLKLYGVSDRKRVFFKVYGIGLYAEEAAVNAKLKEMGGGDSKDKLAEAIINCDGRRVIVLKFVRDVEKSRIQGAFRDGIELSMRVTDERIAEDAEALLGAMRDIKNGEYAELVMDGDGTVKLLGNGEELLVLNNRILGDALIKIYIGQNPLHKNIKAKLLSLP